MTIPIYEVRPEYHSKDWDLKRCPMCCFHRRLWNLQAHVRGRG